MDTLLRYFMDNLDCDFQFTVIQFHNYGDVFWEVRDFTVSWSHQPSRVILLVIRQTAFVSRIIIKDPKYGLQTRERKKIIQHGNSTIHHSEKVLIVISYSCMRCYVKYTKYNNYHLNRCSNKITQNGRKMYRTLLLRS